MPPFRRGTAARTPVSCPTADGKITDTMARFFDQHDGCAIEHLTGRVEDSLEAGNHVSTTCVVQPEEDDGDWTVLDEGGDFAEIEVEGQEDSLLATGLLENLAVRKVMQAFVADMDGIMPQALEPLNHSDIHAPYRPEIAFRPPTMPVPPLARARRHSPKPVRRPLVRDRGNLQAPRRKKRHGQSDRR